MTLRKHLLEAATLIVAAVLCATISNAIAGRERKMALVGTYPNALKVPDQSPAPVEPIPSTASAAPATVPTATAPPVATETVVPLTATTATTPLSQPSSTAKVAAPAIATATQTVPATASPAAPPKIDVARFTPHPEKAYTEITYADTRALHDAGALFLDARRTSMYEQGHITGSRSFSVWESDVDDKVNKLYSERPDPNDQARPIVVYCSGGDCEDSHMLAQKLWGIQFNNVYVYRDGFPDWQKHGAPIHTGDVP